MRTPRKVAHPAGRRELRALTRWAPDHSRQPKSYELPSSRRQRYPLKHDPGLEFGKSRTESVSREPALVGRTKR